MKDVTQILDEANAEFDLTFKNSVIKDNKELRTNFQLGWLRSAYQQLYNEVKYKL